MINLTYRFALNLPIKSIKSTYTDTFRKILHKNTPMTTSNVAKIGFQLQKKHIPTNNISPQYRIVEPQKLYSKVVDERNGIAKLNNLSYSIVPLQNGIVDVQNGIVGVSHSAPVPHLKPTPLAFRTHPHQL